MPKSPEEIRADVEGCISALLTACERKDESMSSDQLCREYLQICGAKLEPSLLGYQTMGEMLRSMPSVVRIQELYGKLMVRAVPNDSSNHIKELVQGQKAPKRAGASKRGRGGFGGSSQPRFPNNTARMVVSGEPYQRYTPTTPWNVPRQNQQQQALSPNPAVKQETNGNSLIKPSPTPANNGAKPSSANQGNGHPVPKPFYVPPHQQQRMPFKPMVPSLMGPPQQRMPQQQQPHNPRFRPMPGPEGLQQQREQQFHNKPAKLFLVPTPRAQPFKDKLFRLAHSHRLGDPIYQHSLLKNGKFVANVEVDLRRPNNKQHFKTSCYPDEFDSVEAAYEAAAKAAFQELEPQYLEAVKKLTETSNVQLMADRIVELVSKAQAGYWSEALFSKYIEVYNETLPENWVQRVQTINPPLVFDKVGDQEQFTVNMAQGSRPNTPLEPQSEPKLAQPNQFFFNSSISDFMNHIGPVVPTAPQPVAVRPIAAQVSESVLYRVQVHSIRAGDKVGIRLLSSAEQQDDWDDMINEMEMHYEQYHRSMRPVEHLESDRLYVGCVDKEWCRLEYMGTSENGQVDVNLVDWADVDKIKASEIYPLEQRFACLPKQGLWVYLEGLSPVRDIGNIISFMNEALMNKHFTAHVVSLNPVITVILYSQNESNGDTQNMNEWIVSQVADKADSIPIKVGGIPQTCVISYVSPNCQVYAVRDTPQQRVVESLISLVAPRIETFPVPTNLSKSAVYMALSQQQGTWCRVKLDNATPTNEGTVFSQLIDYGQPEQVSVKALRDLTPVSPVLARLPGQAIEILLARVPPTPDVIFSDKAAKRLKEIAPPDLRLFMRVHALSSEGKPIVELHQRIELGKLVVVNTTLEVDDSLYELAPEPGVNAVDEKMNQRLAAMNLRKSSSPINPEVVVPPSSTLLSNIRPQNLLGVRVFNVANPFSFWVHFYDKEQELEKLTARMQEVYSRSTVIKNLEASSVFAGGYYVWLNHDFNRYERITVNQHMGSMVSLFLLDRGQMNVVQVTSLRPLLPEFAELPAQAIQAKLHGVKPTEGDWTTHNVIYFKDQVNDRLFQSYVMNIENGNVLSLRLLSKLGEQEQDVTVAQLLIGSQQAMAA